VEEETRFTIYLEQLENYEFKVKFDWGAAQDIVLDEPPPLGERNGPNASRLLAAAVANCLSASLLFCLHKAEVPTGTLRSEATCILTRNQQKRLRVGGVNVRMELLDVDENVQKRLKRCLSMFEDFCVVTASLREGIPVQVDVFDREGNLLHQAQ
jgi:organic hydroperoxide reductase OsmC/OhrA